MKFHILAGIGGLIVALLLLFTWAQKSGRIKFGAILTTVIAILSYAAKQCELHQPAQQIFFAIDEVLLIGFGLFGLVLFVKCRRWNLLSQLVKELIPKPQLLSGFIEALGQVEIRQSTMENIKRVAAQELEVYKGDAVPRKVLEKWYKQNSRGFNMIQYDGEEVGHLNIIAFKQPFLSKFVGGEVLEKEATGADVYSSRCRTIRSLYVESLAILHHAEAVNGRILIQVISDFAEIVSSVCDPNQVEYVYALAATKEGQKLLSRLRFKPVVTRYPRKDRLILFYIRFNDVRHIFWPKAKRSKAKQSDPRKEAAGARAPKAFGGRGF